MVAPHSLGACGNHYGRRCCCRWLIFTGIATYYSAKVAQDQLEQSREDSGQREREQAARVTYWMDGSFWGGTERIHVVNRSPDAVSFIQITLRVTKDKETWEPYTLAERGLHPCSEIVFDPAKLQLTELGDDATSPLTDVGWDIESLHFIDRKGQLWSRTERTLTKSAGRSGVGDADGDTGAVTPDGPPQIKTVEPCGSDA